jgi:hypothetical protein
MINCESGRACACVTARWASSADHPAAGRELIEDLWPELVYKLPPKKPQG